ncbi:MAG: hypothetical protein J4473_02055 [Candidatus Aenigmarchaeota archaeon]|nr:hypothetical protein [Candidatus Aenigmarchaeota archaeon]
MKKQWLNTDRILTIAFWVSLSIFIGWALGKMFGLIRSPEIIEFIPYVAVGISIGVAYQKVTGMISSINKRTIKLEKDFEETSRKLIRIETRCEERHGKIR